MRIIKILTVYIYIVNNFYIDEITKSYMQYFMVTKLIEYLCVSKDIINALFHIPHEGNLSPSQKYHFCCSDKTSILRLEPPS